VTDMDKSDLLVIRVERDGQTWEREHLFVVRAIRHAALLSSSPDPRPAVTPRRRIGQDVDLSKGRRRRRDGTAAHWPRGRGGPVAQAARSLRHCDPEARTPTGMSGSRSSWDGSGARTRDPRRTARMDFPVNRERPRAFLADMDQWMREGDVVRRRTLLRGSAGKSGTGRKPGPSPGRASSSLPRTWKRLHAFGWWLSTGFAPVFQP
jgi:hypothetical protein